MEHNTWVKIGFWGETFWLLTALITNDISIDRWLGGSIVYFVLCALGLFFTNTRR